MTVTGPVTTDPDPGTAPGRVTGKRRSRFRTFAALALAATLGLTTLAAPASAAPYTPDFGSAIEGYAGYVGQTDCDPTAKPGVVDFRSMLNNAYGDHTGYITRACSEGGQSEHKEGRALDYMLNVNDSHERAIAYDILGWLLASDKYGNAHANARRLGIMYLIWNKQIWKSYEAGKGWQTYSGSNPHTDHIHASFSWAGARKQTTWWTATRLDGNRVGIADSGVASVKEGALNSEWTTVQSTRVKQVAVAHDRVAILLTDNSVHFKEGALSSQWYKVEGAHDGSQLSPAVSIAVTANRIGILRQNGAISVKEGAYDNPWETVRSAGTRAFAMSGNRIGALTTDGAVIVKEGSVTAEWSTLNSAGVKAFALGGDRVAVAMNEGEVYFKEGWLGATWQQVSSRGTDVVQVAATGNRIGMMSSAGLVNVKEGAYNAPWVAVRSSGTRSFVLSGNRIGALTTDGAVIVKEGALNSGWSTLSSTGSSNFSIG